MFLPALYNRLGELADRVDRPAWAILVTDQQGNPIRDVVMIERAGEDGSPIIEFQLSGVQS